MQVGFHESLRCLSVSKHFRSNRQTDLSSPDASVKADSVRHQTFPLSSGDALYQALRFGRLKVPGVEEPLYRWVDANFDGTRYRKAVSKGFDVAHLGFADEASTPQGAYRFNRYFLVDAEVSEPLLVNTPEQLTPRHFSTLKKRCEALGVFRVPIYNPFKPAQNIGDYRVPWLREPYTDAELKRVMETSVNRRTNRILSSIPSVGAHYAMTYSNWWLRDSEAVAYAYTHSQNPDPEVRQREHRLGAKITLSNLSQYVSRYYNILQLSMDEPSRGMRLEGPVKVLIDDKARDEIRSGADWSTNSLHIKDQATGERLNHPWPQLQFDALGMHLSAVASHLKEQDCLKWKTLTYREKEAVTVLYAYLLRLKFWDTPDSGAWEFDPDGKLIRSSSVAMATHGMLQLQQLLFAPDGSGQKIRTWMKEYLETMVQPLVKEDKQQAFWQELVYPLTNEKAFEKHAVAPGYRRLYHQLPCEGFFGMDTDNLTDPQNLYKPYHPEKNPAMWDSATLFIPRYAPDLLDKDRMAYMKNSYFPQDDVGEALRSLRSRYARGINAEPRESDKNHDNLDFLPQILNSNKHNLWRRSGIARYFEDSYQNLALQPGKPRPFNGVRNLEPEWTNFPPMQATAWFNRYIKTKDDKDFFQGLDAWNLSMSSLSRFKDIRDDSVKVKWMESVRPYKTENGQYKIQACLIPDLAWSHAETKAMWEAFQQAYTLYAKTHKQV